MKTLLKLEELAQLAACTATLVMHDVHWWAYLLLAVGPDIGMFGYLVGPRTGAFTYNLFHHKGSRAGAGGHGVHQCRWQAWAAGCQSPWLPTADVILYGHSPAWTACTRLRVEIHEDDFQPHAPGVGRQVSRKMRKRAQRTFIMFRTCWNGPFCKRQKYMPAGMGPMSRSML
jgi:hypothetical protein